MKKVSSEGLALFFIFLFTHLEGQIFNPVKWSFDTKVVTNDEVDIVFTAAIDPGWHLYGHYIPDNGPVPTTFTLKPSDHYKLSGKLIEVSKGLEKYDESFGVTLKLFSHTALFKQRIKVKSANDFTIEGFVQFMCCDDEKCLPPKDIEFQLPVKGVKPIAEVKPKEQIATNIQTANTHNDPVEKIDSLPLVKKSDSAQPVMAIADAKEISEITSTEETQTTEKKSLLALFFKAIGAGLLGLFMPCIFPMIPITISFFLRGNKTRAKSIFHSLIFSISIILIYTLVGLIVSLTSAGADFANTLSNHWIPNSIFFLVFVLFAASFFGMFELVLPGSLANKVDKQADRGGIIGIFFMALALVIVSFSCIGPLVGYILIEASRGEVLEPAIGMLGFSTGLAIPFFILTIFPAMLKRLPKSGGWLNALKVVLGFIILASSFEFLMAVDQHQKILTREVFLSVWIAICIILGLYLLGKIRFKYDSEVKHIGVPRLLLAILTFAFVIYMIPGLFGAPLKMISPLIPPKTNQSFNLISLFEPNKFSSVVTHDQTICNIPKYSDFLSLPHELKGYFDYEEGIACAKELNKPVLLDFKGHKCSNCKRMENKVWSDPEVLKRLKNDFVIIALYIDDNTMLPEKEWVTSEYDGKVKKTMGKKNLDLEIIRFNSNSQPLYVIVDHNGNELTDKPYSLNLDANEFVKFLDTGKNNYYKLREF